MKLDWLITILGGIGALGIAIIFASRLTAQNPVTIYIEPPPVPTPRWECRDIRDKNSEFVSSPICCCVFIRPRWDGTGITDDQQPVNCVQASCP